MCRIAIHLLMLLELKHLLHTVPDIYNGCITIPKLYMVFHVYSLSHTVSIMCNKRNACTIKAECHILLYLVKDNRYHTLNKMHVIVLFSYILQNQFSWYFTFFLYISHEAIAIAIGALQHCTSCNLFMKINAAKFYCNHCVYVYEKKL